MILDLFWAALKAVFVVGECVHYEGIRTFYGAESSNFASFRTTASSSRFLLKITPAFFRLRLPFFLAITFPTVHGPS